MSNETITGMVADLAAAIAQLPEDEQVNALNEARQALHDVGPFFGEPVDLVIWISAGEVVANDYNPNQVAPPEMELLRHSIMSDGFTQPIVTYPNGDRHEVVDGFHRNRVGRECDEVRERVRGYLPVVRINTTRESRADRVATTIRHNRARGRHQIGAMANIVRELYELGWSDRQIQGQLGMDADEVTRLKQVTGLAALFRDREFSEAWEPE